MSLDDGDSLRLSDKFAFFRGNNTDASSGRRDVPFNDLVTLLNDPDVLTNVGGGLTWSVVATNTSAVAGNGYLVDCSAAVRTITLPTSPTAGDEIHVSDFTGSSSSFNITIARGGESIDSVAEDLIVNINKATVKLVYANASIGWAILMINEVN